MEIRQRTLYGFLIVFIILSSFLNFAIDNTSVFPASRKIVFDTPQKAILQLVWTFRNLIADILWFKVDYYHHSKGNIEQVDPHENDSWYSDLSTGKICSHDHSKHKAVSDLSSLTGDIKDKDFNLKRYRKVALYLPEIIPLLRLITYLNPKFDRAYSLGGYMLVKWMNKKKQGYIFLDEGIKNNPDSEEILTTYSILLMIIEKQYDRPLEFLTRAFGIIKSQPEFMENDLWPTTLHLLKIVYKKNGQKKKEMFINKEIGELTAYWLKKQKSEEHHHHKHEHH